jgi:NAD(P)-dependent dehydrogenase (short-subunit alcohol dehydrogenase family)
MSFFLGFLYRQFIYAPPVPTASFAGKSIIVTGGNVGLGKEAIRWFIKLGASEIILACRNVDKGKAAAKDIQETTSCSADTIQVWELDMSSYKSVIAFGERAKTLPRLDALVSNAGLGTRTFRMTEDNEELITTNVVSLFLHAFLLFPKLQETGKKYNTQTYFTITSSELYEVAKFKERKVPAGQLFAALADEKQANMMDRYNVSKLLEVFMVKQIALLSPLDTGKVIVNCTAPG